MPDVYLTCTICQKPAPDWAVYELPAAMILDIPRKRARALPGDNVCGSCISHARDLGLLTDRAYKAIAANGKNATEKARTAHEFK